MLRGSDDDGSCAGGREAGFVGGDGRDGARCPLYALRRRRKVGNDGADAAWPAFVTGWRRHRRDRVSMVCGKLAPAGEDGLDDRDRSAQDDREDPGAGGSC
jgi:hypothetical protein